MIETVRQQLEVIEQHFQSGRLADAFLAAQHLLSQDPGQIDALRLMGKIAGRASDYGRATQAFQDVLRMDPNDIGALNGLCAVLRRVGDVGRALEYGSQAIDLSPHNREIRLNVGLCLLDLWRFDEALVAFDETLAIDPDYAIAHHNRATTLMRLGRGAEAVEAFRRAIELAPKAPDSHVSLGKLLMQLGEVGAAESCFAQAEEVAGNHVPARLALSAALLSAGMPLQAERILRGTLLLAPEAAEAHSQLGDSQRQLGRFKEAAGCFQRAMDLDPSRTKPLHDLIYSRRVSEDDRPLIQQIQAKLVRPNLPPNVQKDLHYSLGKAFDDLGEYSRAIRHFDEANGIMARQLAGRDNRREGLRQSVDRIIDTFTPEFFQREVPYASESHLPILIVGMIRSGTTLFEQILSSHPDVEAGGELHFLLQNGAVLGPDNQLIQSKAQALITNYLRLLQSLAPGRTRITDKMPQNFPMLGVVHALFPNARIIHCKRNPADTCLSIYVTPYGEAVNFAHEPSEIVFSYRQYQRLMAHWRKVLPADRFLEIDYESLVEDRETTVHQVLDFAGLSWNDACLHHEDRGGAVLTPSNWQVRQPMYRSSIGRYANYAQWLPEFAELLNS